MLAPSRSLPIVFAKGSDELAKGSISAVFVLVLVESKAFDQSAPKLLVELFEVCVMICGEVNGSSVTLGDGLRVGGKAD